MHAALPPPLYLRPIVKRSLATIRQHLSEGQAAFFLGSGVDIQLACDAGVGREARSWQRLISELWAGVNGAGTPAASRRIRGCPKERTMKCCKDIYYEKANQWPTEMASLIRWWLGDQKFSQEIDRLIKIAGYTPRLDQPFTRNLCQLLVKTNLIVTPNYSELINITLRKYFEENGINKKIVVFNREDLGTFPFPASKPKNDIQQIFLVHIHGRCSSQSFPILDAWGYNILGNEDTYYQRFLETLFTERHVITLGNSWTDIPQRNAAAYAQRTKHYLSKTHLAGMIYWPDTEPWLDPADAVSVDRKWANTMKAAYGANVVRVKNTDQGALLAEVGRPLAQRPNITDDLSTVADYFDDAGDYESPLQHELLRSFGAHDPIPRKVIESGVENLCALVRDSLANGIIEWQVAARLERHLRHHIWVYLKGESRDRCRPGFWQDLANRVPPIDVFRRLTPQLRFDFLVGKFEIPGTIAITTWNDYSSTIRDSVLHDRLEMVRGMAIWKKVKDLLTEEADSGEDEFNKLNQNAEELLKKGWESMAAKVLLNGAELLARMARAAEDGGGGSTRWKEVVGQAMRAEAVARTAGCFRRRVKADVIGAIWNQDHHESRTRLLGRLRASESDHGVEPGLKHAIGAGLLACLLRSLGKEPEPTEFAPEAKRLFQESGLEDGLLCESLEPYWRDLMPGKLAECLQKLRKHLEPECGP